MDKRGQISTAIRNKVHDRLILRRLETLVQLFERMKTELAEIEGLEPPVFVNHAVVMQLLYNYYYDIERVKHFHGMKRVNEAKKAAYLIKWIIRGKPIYFDYTAAEKPSDLPGLLACFNEIFAIRVAVAYARIPLKYVDDEIMDGMLYQLVFRHAEEGLLTLWFEMFLANSKLRDRPRSRQRRRR